MPKYALILQTTCDNAFTFRSTRGFYNKHVHDLEQAGYKIIKVDVDNIKSQLASFSPSSVGFLWIRMHGSPKSMTASNKLKITLENMTEIFESLPSILSESAYVYLESCSTGYFLPDFNNMQFGFAKLTLAKPMVKIVAPRKNSHIAYFSINEDGSFNFEEQEHGYMNEKNIAVVLGQETKAILSNAIEHNIPFASISDEINKSLQITEECPFLENFKTEYRAGLCAASFDLTTVIMNTIEIYSETGECNIGLEHIRKLIEEFHASPNFEKGHWVVAYSIHCTEPLVAAIYYQHTELVKYLLENGADPLYSFKGETTLDFAKRVDENTHSMNQWKKECINSRREKMNDHAKMADLIVNHMEASKRQKSAYINLCLWNSNEVKPELVYATTNTPQNLGLNS